jgi:hypothetical protein
MVYIDRYVPIYMFKYIYVHIRVRQQLEHTLKLKTKKKRNETLYSRWGVREHLRPPPP